MPELLASSLSLEQDLLISSMVDVSLDTLLCREDIVFSFRSRYALYASLIWVLRRYTRVSTQRTIRNDKVLEAMIGEAIDHEGVNMMLMVSDEHNNR